MEPQTLAILNNCSELKQSLSKQHSLFIETLPLLCQPQKEESPSVLNQQRAMLHIKKVISEATKYILFEFNDVFTRSAFSHMITPYLEDVKKRGGIFDYNVICNETNNTPEVVNSNRFVGDIYIKPAKTVNFVQLKFVAGPLAACEFDEIVGRF